MRSPRIVGLLLAILTAAAGLLLLGEGATETPEPAAPGRRTVQVKPAGDVPREGMRSLAAADRETGARVDAALDPREAAAPQKGTIRIVVRDRHNGAPVARAHVWVFSEALAETDADATGRASFEVEPGSYSVGVDRPPGSLYVALPYDVDTDDPAAEEDVEVAAGETKDVVLELHRGASIVGRVLDASGDALPDFVIVSMSAEEDRWVSPVRRTTDSSGAFEINGLRGGWYLLGPESDGIDVFTLERMELKLGETRSVEIRLSTRRVVRIHVRILCDGEVVEGGPPVGASLKRGDGLGDLARPRFSTRRLARADLPHEWVVEVCDGPYDLVFMPNSVGGSLWLVEYWNHRHSFRVTESTRQIDIDIERPVTGPYVTIDGLLSRELPRGSPAIEVRCMSKAGHSIGGALRLDADRKSFRVHVDLAYVTSEALEFLRHDTVFATVSLADGPQQVTLTPPPD